MTNWRKKVDIKAILEDEEMDEVEQARRILSVLRKHEEFVEHDDGLLLEEMEDAIEELAETGDNKWFNAVSGWRLRCGRFGTHLDGAVIDLDGLPRILRAATLILFGIAMGFVLCGLLTESVR